MADETKSQSYDDFRESASGYDDDRGHDLLTDPGATQPAQDIQSHGDRIKHLRERHGFTTDELAAKAGISHDVLKRVESGEQLLPLGLMTKLSKALSLKMSDVISEGREPYTIVRSHDRTSVSRFGKAKQESYGYQYESLAANKKDRLMEPFIVTLQPATVDEPSSHDGQEFIYVLEGELEVVIGDHSDLLKPGDAVYYDSNVTHLVKAHGDTPTKILAVLVS